MYKVSKDGRLICRECGHELYARFFPENSEIVATGDHKAIIIHTTEVCKGCGFEHELTMEIDTDDVD